MENLNLVISVCALFVVIINLFIGIIVAFILKAIYRLEDRHVASVKELHEKIEKHDEKYARRREKDLTEMREKFNSIDVKLAVLVPDS